MRRKRILMLIGSVCLALLLALPLVASCGPATPEEAAGEIAKLETEIDELEGDVSAKDAEISDLEAEIAALRAPGEVIEITFQCVAAGGTIYGKAVDIKEILEEVSGGRLQVELVLGEAIVPTEEMLEAVRDGVYDMLTSWDTYFPEKIPTIRIADAIQLLLRNQDDFWIVMKRGVFEIMTQAYADYGVHLINESVAFPGDTLTSTVPVPDFAALKGMKIRCGGCMGFYLEAADASTVWLPSEEIYTSLASGLVDGATYGHPGVFVEFGFPEVSKYWILPSFEQNVLSSMLANMDFWNGLSEADQALITHISNRAALITSSRKVNSGIEGIEKADELGVTVQYWSEDSIKQWTESAFAVMKRPTDPAGLRALDILLDYVRARGYID